MIAQRMGTSESRTPAAYCQVHIRVALDSASDSPTPRNCAPILTASDVERRMPLFLQPRRTGGGVGVGVMRMVSACTVHSVYT